MPRNKTTAEWLRSEWPRASLWLLSFGFVLFLGLEGGGYDVAVRSEVGIGVWLVLAVGALAGLLPATRPSRAARVALALLAGYAVWTTLGIVWSESAERSFSEAARALTYLGVFALALALYGRAGLRTILSAVGSAIALIAALALLSRLHPQWFPLPDPAELPPYAQERLNYPLNYWNGLAALIALGIPIVLAFAVRARAALSRALAAAAIPVMLLAAYFTFSRGGVVQIALGIVVLVAVMPTRLAAVPTLALVGAASAALLALAARRDALEEGPFSELARDQGAELLWIVIAVSIAAALLRYGLARLEDRGRLIPPAVPRRTALRALAVAAVLGVVVAVAAGVPGRLSEQWSDFKEPTASTGSAARFETLSGNGRYQYWGQALDAAGTEPLVGIGPGTYEFWWKRHAELPGTIRSAHSLYFETLAELGVVGILAVGGFLVVVLWAGVRRARDATPGDLRTLAAAGVASLAVFVVGAGIDWLWQLPVIPVAFLLIAAAMLAAPAREGPDREGTDPGTRRWLRIAVPVAALPVLALLATVTAGAVLVTSSESDVEAGDLEAALGATEDAAGVQPYAASPYIQEALVRAEMDDLDGAADAARTATEKEATNWETWYVLAQVEEAMGEEAAARAHFQQSFELNPRSEHTTEAVGAPGAG